MFVFKFCFILKKVCDFVVGYLLFFYNGCLDEIVYLMVYEVVNIFIEFCKVVIYGKLKLYIKIFKIYMYMLNGKFNMLLW